MEFDLEQVRVWDNPDSNRYEATLDGELLAIAEYERFGTQIAFTHTEVQPAAEGKGVSSKLVRAALDEARDRQAGVIPLCPFVKSYIQRHPEYQPLVRTR